MIYNTKIVDFIKNELNNDISLFKETPFYENNPDLKKGNLLFDITIEEHQEITSIKDDIIKLGNTYCYANTHDGYNKKIELRKYQEEYLLAQKENRFLVTVASRQVGKTLLEAIYCMNQILHGKKILLITNLRDSCIEILDRVKMIYRNMPFYLKPGIQAWNQTSIVFDNGARIYGAGSSKGSFIGKSFDLVYIDEAAHINHNNFLDIYHSVFPQILKENGQLIIQSTPNGRNKFYEIYDGATKGTNLFTPYRIEWNVVPGRDENWKNSEIANLGSEHLFNREYGLSFDSENEETRKKLIKDIVDITSKMDESAKKEKSLLEERLERIESMLGIKNN